MSAIVDTHFLVETPREIRLYGRAGVLFGRVHYAVVNNTADAVRYLCQMIPGFHSYLARSADAGIGFACFIGKQNIDETQLDYPVGKSPIRIAPIIRGSKRGGLFSIVLGAALIGVSFIPGLNVAVWAGASATWATVAFGMGASLLLSGVQAMMAPRPNSMAVPNSPENKPSYNFSGPVTTYAQGNAMPLLYGEMHTGSARLSASIISEDQQ